MTGRGAVRYACKHLQGGLVVYLHERFEVINTRMRGPQEIWKQISSIVDNGRGLYAGEHTMFSRDSILATTEISQAAYEALAAAALKGRNQ